MAGRYPQSNVAQHPSILQADEQQAKHEAIAAELMPAELNEDERRVWLRLAPELSKHSRLKRHFIDFIAEYCIVKVRMDGWRNYLDKNEWSYITTGRHGEQHKSRPEVAQLNDDWRKWNSLVAQIGLSPATELRFNDKQGGLFDDDDFNTI